MLTDDGLVVGIALQFFHAGGCPLGWSSDFLLLLLLDRLARCQLATHLEDR